MDDLRLSLEQFLPYRLNRLADAVSRNFSSLYKERSGMTRPEWRLLATLGQYGTMTATEVGKHSSMHKTKVSRAVTALEARRWLERRTNSEDKRVEHLVLSKSGEKAYKDLVPLARGFEEKLLDQLSEQDRKTVLAGLGILERVALTD
jgi:DNA-binding MarR family transcriptional regulator